VKLESKMSRLSDLIAEVADGLREQSAAVTIHDVVAETRGRVDDDDRAQLIDEALAERAKRYLVRARGAANDTVGAGQGALPFGLQAAYPVDLDGRQIKSTRHLTRVELRRVIAIREASVQADQAKLHDLRLAEVATAPYWDADPALLFGDVIDAAIHANLTAGAA
jgi:hypothetical protein